jgi:hypothetical protein
MIFIISTVRCSSAPAFADKQMIFIISTVRCSSTSAFAGKEMRFLMSTVRCSSTSAFAGKEMRFLMSNCVFQERRVSATIPITLPIKDIDRRVKLEIDAIHDGFIRHSQSRECQHATDSKPIRDLVGNSLKPLAGRNPCRTTCLEDSQRQKLPKYKHPVGILQAASDD